MAEGRRGESKERKRGESKPQSRSWPVSKPTVSEREDIAH